MKLLLKIMFLLFSISFLIEEETILYLGDKLELSQEIEDIDFDSEFKKNSENDNLIFFYFTTTLLTLSTENTTYEVTLHNLYDNFINRNHIDLKILYCSPTYYS